MWCFTYRHDNRTLVWQPVPWNRPVKALTRRNGVREIVDPPEPVERFVKLTRREQILRDVAALEPEWAETEAEWIARCRAKAIPVGATDVKLMDDAAIPKDRTFRDAWKPDLTVDMGKARDLWRNRMREARAPRLAALDVDYLRADETQRITDKKAIIVLKQALRDVTDHPGIEAAKTPDELKRVWPDCLPAMKD